MKKFSLLRNSVLWLSSITLGFLFFLNFSSFTFASTPGNLDSTFSNGTYPGADSGVLNAVEQPDGKVVIVGGFTLYNGYSSRKVARINADGSLDSSFNVGTGADCTNIGAVALQSDGKVLIGGCFNSYNGTAIHALARLNSDGSLDTTFNNGVGITGTWVFAINVQSDGKILVGGYFTAYNGVARNNIMRLNSDGSLDSSFNPGTGTDNMVTTIAMQSTGKVLVGGPFTKFNNVSSGKIARLNTDGSLDGTFSSGTGFLGGAMWKLAVQSDDKIMAGGYFSAYNGTTRYGVARLNSDGTIDSGFDTSVGVSYSAVKYIDILDSGKILIGGYFSSFNGVNKRGIVLVNSDASVDNSFDVGTGASIDVVLSLSTGKIIAGGTFNTFNGYVANNIAGLNSSGTKDANFVQISNTGANDYINSVKVQSNGKILVAGDFTSVSGTTRNRIARLNTDGTLDTSFTPTTSFSAELTSLAIQSDGKIIVGGSKYTGPAFIRLNTDGSEDSSYDVGTAFDDDIYQIALQSDDKALVAGYFNDYNGSTANYFARINTDGTIDNTFDMGTGFDDEVTALGVQSDGKIIVAGWFTEYDGTSVPGIVRLNTDGSLDDTFVPGAGIDYPPKVIQPLSDGRILIGGYISSYDGNDIYNIVRLNSDGSYDGTFDPGTGPDDEVDTIAVQTDDSIILGGYFTNYNGNEASGIARISEDGSFDTTFVANTYEGDPVYSVVIQSDYKILVAGDFLSVNDEPAAYITRLNGEAVLAAEDSDTTAPTGSVTIDDGATSTNTQNVTLTISATDDTAVSQMRICSNSSFTGCDWESYTTSKNFTLLSGEGTKSVYIQFKDAVGNMSNIYSDSILLLAEEPDSEVGDTQTGSNVTIVESDTYTSNEENTTGKEIIIKVVDENGNAVEGAFVSTGNISRYTDENGEASFEDLNIGTNSVTITYLGKITQKEIEVLGTEKIENFSLSINTTNDNGEKSQTSSKKTSNSWLFGSLGIIFVLIILFVILFKGKRNLK